jgi:hypothetical protein
VAKVTQGSGNDLWETTGDSEAALLLVASVFLSKSLT